MPTPPKPPAPLHTLWQSVSSPSFQAQSTQGGGLPLQWLGVGLLLGSAVAFSLLQQASGLRLWVALQVPLWVVLYSVALVAYNAWVLAKWPQWGIALALAGTLARLVVFAPWLVWLLGQAATKQGALVLVCVVFFGFNISSLAMVLGWVQLRLANQTPHNTPQ